MSKCTYNIASCHWWGVWGAVLTLLTSLTCKPSFKLFLRSALLFTQQRHSWVLFFIKKKFFFNQKEGGRKKESHRWKSKPSRKFFLFIPVFALCYWYLSIFSSTFYVFFDGSVGKESTCNTGDMGLLPGSGRSPGGRNGDPLQCSCMRNLMDREA